MIDKKNGSFLIYVVEDNEWYNKLLVHNLSLRKDFEIKSFLSAKDLLKEIHHLPDIVTVDYRLPDMLGDELLKQIKNFNTDIEVIMISEQDDIEVAVELLKKGAADYLVKSKDIKERLLHAVNKIETNSNLKKELSNLKSEIQGRYEFQKSLIGNSPVMKKVFDTMSKALNTNISVSITGATGTGKEVVAKAIHYNSYCKDGPFVALNMAAIPSELIESELFGHEKGAFTGANAKRIGKFQQAQGGTLFLDEIGEMDINLQAKLLRVLQEKEVTPIGGNKTIKINCRIIVATNRDLANEVKNKNFREDLYYRFLGLPIHLPPLKERGNDVILLSDHFINLFAKENNLSPKELSKEAKKKLLNYTWPGNIRELKSVIDLAFVLSSSDIIEEGDITLQAAPSPVDQFSENMTLREYNILVVKNFMKKYNNNTKMVADKLGIGQTTVYRMLKEDEEAKTSEEVS
ncbi:MAG: sigma-54-dependent Fis family transcriptional regulator [Crocinitomicaceae bacterium]|nr:sigma-54-dependent Fis family transcriptional regulator [Crocinitomicaceae bacterium]